MSAVQVRPRAPFTFIALKVRRYASGPSGRLSAEGGIKQAGSNKTPSGTGPSGPLQKPDLSRHITGRGAVRRLCGGFAGDLVKVTGAERIRVDQIGCNRKTPDRI